MIVGERFFFLRNVLNFLSISNHHQFLVVPMKFRTKVLQLDVVWWFCPGIHWTCGRTTTNFHKTSLTALPWTDITTMTVLRILRWFISHSSAETAVKISKLAGFTRGVALSILTYTCLGTVEEKKRKNVDPIPAAEETVGMISWISNLKYYIYRERYSNIAETLSFMMFSIMLYVSIYPI